MATTRKQTRSVEPGRTYSGEDLDCLLEITDEDKQNADAELERLEREGQVWKGRLDETEEGRRLLANPKFRATIEAARKSRAQAHQRDAQRESMVD
jgi:chromosome segregation and condensation protein ScpB